MSYTDYLKDLLRPLGVYDLEGAVNGASLAVKGAALDRVAEELEEVGRESDLTTAEDWGLENWRRVLELSPVTGEVEQLRRSLWALLRIRAGMSTLGAIEDTLEGCGIHAAVEELGPGRVRVSFPGVGGVPDGFTALQGNIQAILPAHVQISYRFLYLTWGDIRARGWTFGDIQPMTWRELAMSV